jgi:hypothetical protein
MDERGPSFTGAGDNNCHDLGPQGGYCAHNVESILRLCTSCRLVSSSTKNTSKVTPNRLHSRCSFGPYGVLICLRAGKGHPTEGGSRAAEIVWRFEHSVSCSPLTRMQFPRASPQRKLIAGWQHMHRMPVTDDVRIIWSCHTSD